MEEKKKDIQQRKQMVQSQMAIPQQQPHGQQAGMPGQQGIAPAQQHMMGQVMSIPPQGMPPHQQGVPPNQPGMMGQTQGQRMGGPVGMQQNTQGARMGGPGGLRPNTPQRMEGPGGFNNQNQRMRFPQQNDNMRIPNPQQQVRMGGPRGQIRMQMEGNQEGGMNQQNQGFGGPRQRFPGGPRFNNQNNQMNRMPGPRGPMGRGQRPLMAAENNPFRRHQGGGQEDSFGEGGEEDMCLEDEIEGQNETPVIGDNPFRRPEIQRIVAEEEEEDIEEDLMRNMGSQHQPQGMQHNMNLRGHNPNQFRGQNPNMQMRGNFHMRGNPRAMGGPRGQMSQHNQMKPLGGNAPPRMPQRGPVSLMDLKFDKPPPHLQQRNENKEQEADSAVLKVSSTQVKSR